MEYFQESDDGRKGVRFLIRDRDGKCTTALG